MKNYFKMLLALILLSACGKDDVTIRKNNVTENGDMQAIVLGEQLRNPYSVENVNEALKKLYPTRTEREGVDATDLYVRFLPENEKELDILTSMGVELIDHPVDYRIIREGDYYHDPAIDKGKITWQYAIVPQNFKFPESIKYEKLSECYIAEHDPNTRSGGNIDWELVEQEAFRITGNEDMLVPQTRGGQVEPEGRITIVDDKLNGGKPFGVAGVKVSCNCFVRFSSAYTDRDGYYKMGRSFSSKPRYRLIFSNEKGFDIGLNLILVKGFISSLGKAGPEGISLEITKKSDRTLFTRAVVNNTVYEYINHCDEEDFNIPAPPKGLRIWIFKNLKLSSSIMMHQGAILDNNLVSTFLGKYKWIVRIFAPDILLGLKDKSDYSSIYSATCHELAHASHFSQVGIEYWDKFIKYMLTSFVKSGGQTYGNGEEENAGYCEVGEMWAYYMESRMYKERYGGPLLQFGTSYWFKPQIFRNFDERGVEPYEIFSVLTKDVTSKELLKEKIKKTYPRKKKMVDQVFNRYNN